MLIEVRDSLAEIDAGQWNALSDQGNPFLQHEFLHTLQDTGCLGDATGWYPRYFLLWSGEEHDSARELLGAVPAYVKTNSYGEFVFDWSWADAYERNHMAYYPKLVVGIPFTPATGPRLLVRPDQPFDELARLLVIAITRFADGEDYSSVHYLFLTDREKKLLTTGDDPSLAEHLSRMDCQFHWHNDDYKDFEDFLSRCTARRRKTIRRERRYTSDAGLRLQRRSGDSLSAEEWHWVHRLYESTYDRKWGNPSLTEAFFRVVGQRMGKQLLIVLAYDDTDDTPDRPVACSIMFAGGDTLYGRYWGSRRNYNSLHFETCYYQGIEFAIERGLKHFEPGAQGEHKITRGFVPTLTHSAHYIRHPGFREAIENYLQQERPHVEQRCAGLGDLLPFKADPLSL